jgi:glutaredoxin
MREKIRRFVLRFLKIYAGLLLVGFGATALYLAWHRDRIFPALDTVVIYGRDTCGVTTDMRTTLTEAKVPFKYVNVDDGYLQDQEMQYLVQVIPHQKPQSGYIQFPVVRVAGQLFERPDHERVLSLYKSAGVQR